MSDQNYTAMLKNRTLEYLAEPHLYIVDGVLVPSITSLVDRMIPNRYRGVPAPVLQRAAGRGIEVHEAVEAWVKTGKPSDLPELAGFKFLQKNVPFKVLESETPVILENEGVPVAAGRLDLVLQRNAQIGGADIKRIAKLDLKYLGYQLNLYRVAYFHTYGKAWEFMAAIQLRDQVRKWVDIPIDESLAEAAVETYLKEIQ